MVRSRLIGSLCGLAVLLCLAITGHASAATPTSNFNLTVSPIYVTLATHPGESVTTPLKVQNNTLKTEILNVKLMQFKAYGSNGEADIVAPNPNDPSTKWVRFSATTITAQPGAWNTITMTISPPSTAGLGYYYAVMFTVAGQADKPAQNISSVSGSSAIPVLLDVQVPGEKRAVSVANFATNHHVYEFLPATFQVTVKNTGDIYTAPTGDIYVSRNQKDNLAVIPINQTEGNVIPGTNRTYTADWNDGFPAHIIKRINGQIVTDKNGNPETTLSWNLSQLNKFRFGKYYAHLLLVYNNGKQDVPVESEVSFWVIPWRIMIVFSLIIILVLFGLLSLMRRVITVSKKAVRRSSNDQTTSASSQQHAQTRHKSSK